MAARKNFSNHKSVIKEIDDINDIDELRRISRTLIKENLALSRKSNVTHRCLDKQNTLIKYLQDSLDDAMVQNDEGANLLNQFLGRETLRVYDEANDFHSSINCLVKRNTFQGEEKEMARELLDIVESVPLHSTKESQDKIKKYLANLDGFQVPKENPEDDVKDNMEKIDVEDEVKNENTVQRKKASKKRNGKSTSKKNKKQGLKKKAEVMNEPSLVTGLESTQKIGGTKKSSVFNSVNEPIDLKDFDVKVTDFMHDTSVDNDPFIAKFKQISSLYQMNEELKVVDADSEQKVESNNFDESKEDDGLEEGQTSFKSVESRDLEGKSLLSKSTAVSCEESTIPDKDPSTSDIYIDFPDMSRRGPRTPSPPAHAEE